MSSLFVHDMSSKAMVRLSSCNTVIDKWVTVAQRWYTLDGTPNHLRPIGYYLAHFINL